MRWTRGEEELLRWSGELGNDPDAVARLSSALVAFDPSRSSRCRSTLNNDGSPLQVCLTTTAERRSVRLIVDPTAGIDSQAEQRRVLAATLGRMLPLVDASPLSPAIEQMIDAVLPPASEPSLDSGLAWIAAGVDGGAAVYGNTRWGNAQDRWTDVSRWLQSVLPADDAAQSTLRSLRHHCVLASAGLEGKDPKQARAKCYWRLTHPTPLAAIGPAAFAPMVFADFFAHLGADEQLPLSGLVWSSGFSLDDGSFSDSKVDVCGHCLRWSSDKWFRVIDDWCAGNSMAPFDLADGLIAGRGEVAFLGLGVMRRDGAPRLNVYLKARQE